MQNISKRHIRQIQFEPVGINGQNRIADSSILIVGVGGLGCPAAQYLAAAGVGRLGLIDFDSVEISNLHRQLLYSEHDLGKSKAEVASEKLRNQFPDCKIEAYHEELGNQRAIELFSRFDLVIDGTDQVHIRYLINDACVLLEKPWVFGSINGFEGQWALFEPGKADYRDVFPVPPNPMNMKTCANSGVLGMIPGTIGTIQALSAIQYLCGINLGNEVLHTLDLQSGRSYDFHLKKEARHSLTMEEFMKRDYLKYIMNFHYKI